MSTTTNDDHRDGYTVEEFSRRWGISTRHGWKLVHSGALPSVKLGKSRRIPAAAVEEWIAAQLEQSAA